MFWLPIPFLCSAIEKAILEDFSIEKALTMNPVEPCDYIWKYVLLKDFKNDPKAAAFNLLSAPQDNELANLFIARTDTVSSGIQASIDTKCEVLKKIGSKISEDFFVNKFMFRELTRLDSLGTINDIAYILKNIWSRDEFLIKKFFLYIDYRMIDLKKVIRELEFLAKHKYANALYLLGHAYLVGYGVEMDLDKALEYFWGSHKFQHLGMGMLGLGKVLLTDEYKNEENALQSFKLVQSLSAEAMYYVSIMTEEKEEKSIEDSICLKSAAISGYLPAVYKLSVEYIKNGHLDSAYYSLLSVTQFHPIFLHYDSIALEAYLKKNYKKALLIYLMLAKFNLKNPVLNALHILENKKLFENQDKILFDIYNHLAQTDQSFNTKLGNLYLEGRGVEASASKAFSCYLAAKAHSTTGAYSLAWMYENGIGVARNYFEAIRIIKKHLNRDALYLIRFYSLLRIYTKIALYEYPIKTTILIGLVSFTLILAKLKKY